MRILHITRDFPPRTNGGISTAVGGMVRASCRAGMACAVVSFDGWRPNTRSRRVVASPAAFDQAAFGPAAFEQAAFEQAAFGPTAFGPAPAGAAPHADPRHHVPVLRLSRPDELPAAARFVEAFAPSLVHVHHGMLWSFAADVRERGNIPAVVQVHVLQAEQNRLRGVERDTLSLAAQRRAVHEADGVIAPSHAAARLLEAHHPEVSQVSQVRVIGLGVDDSAAARAAVAARTDHPSGGSPGDGPGPILYAGRFADINGIAELFAAIPKIIARAPAARFIIAGGLPDNPRAESRWRERFYQDTPGDVAARVTFSGWQQAGKLSQLYARASVVMSPSWLETFGMVVLEAMQHGAAIAATRSGGVEELIEHQVTGLLSQPRDDIDALVEHVVTLHDQRATALTMGRAAAADVRARRLWSHIVPDLSRFYETIA